MWPPELDHLKPFSMASATALRHLYALGSDLAERGIAGDIVECGVFNGGSAGALACGLRASPRHFWLYDSFAGMPPASAADGPDAAPYVGQGVGSAEKAREAMRVAGVAESALTIRPGWFADTFALPLPERVALLHIDCDWYESVALTLRTFYDRVNEGGIVILDDFGHWDGAREAFYDFVFERGLKPLVERFGHSQLFWIKGRTHNRDQRGRTGVRLSP
jgi:O-methyltransferase